MRNPRRPSSDDSAVKRPRRLDDRSADALLRGRSVEGEPGLSTFVSELHDLGEGPAPAPSDALAAMLATGVGREDRVTIAPGEQPVVPQASTWSRRQLRPSRALAGLGAVLVAVLGTAQANALPAPAQDAVATAVSWITPLDLPRPDDDGAEQQPAVTPTSPAVPVTPSHRATPAAVPNASPSPGPRQEATDEATDEATPEPTDEVIDEPTEEPTEEPADEPTEEPTDESTEEPSADDPLGLGDIMPKL